MFDDEWHTRGCCGEKWWKKMSACKHSGQVCDCCESAGRSLFPFGKANGKVDMSSPDSTSRTEN